LYVGIDVGGTYTDAVLMEGRTVIRKKKTPTRHENLLSSLLEALDGVLEGVKVSEIRRVVLSTTLVTNIIAEKKYPPVALVIIPGPGLSHSEYRFDTLTRILAGAIDYRGRELVPVNKEEIISAGNDIEEKGYTHIAVAGKFSCRNNSHEKFIKEVLEKNNPGALVEMSHTVSGRLNFPRRIATTVLTAATKEVFFGFIRDVSGALKNRGITAPSFILKADGGTIPLDSGRMMPVETIFSGPAASALGAMALSPEGQTSVVVDIGGTTTDLALILAGEPMMASKGALVDRFLTQVESFSVKSVPLGGDSVVTVINGKIEILPKREGPPYCLGGKEPTPTDALRYLDRVEAGDKARAEAIIEKLAGEAGISPGETAAEVVKRAGQIIVSAIEQMFISWEQEPAYRIWELMQRKKIRPNNVVGVGGAARGLIPGVAETMGCRAIVPEHAEVANALGAAVAQPTVTANVRIDTEHGIYTVAEDGKSGTVPKGRMFREEDAVKLARDCLFKRAEDLKIKEYVKKVEVVHSEVFNMVRGWTTTGKIYDITVQTPRDILFYIEQEGSDSVWSWGKK